MSAVQGTSTSSSVHALGHGALPNDDGDETGRQPRDGGALSTGRRRKGARDGGVLTQGTDRRRGRQVDDGGVQVTG